MSHRATTLTFPQAWVSCRSAAARLAVPTKATLSLSLGEALRLGDVTSAHAPRPATQNPAPAAADVCRNRRRDGPEVRRAIFFPFRIITKKGYPKSGYPFEGSAQP